MYPSTLENFSFVRNVRAFATGKPSGVLIVKLFIKFLIVSSLTLLTNVLALQIATRLFNEKFNIFETSFIFVSVMFVSSTLVVFIVATII